MRSEKDLQKRTLGRSLFWVTSSRKFLGLVRFLFSFPACARANIFQFSWAPSSTLPGTIPLATTATPSLPALSIFEARSCFYTLRCSWSSTLLLRSWLWRVSRRLKLLVTLRTFCSPCVSSSAGKSSFPPLFIGHSLILAQCFSPSFLPPRFLDVYVSCLTIHLPCRRHAQYCCRRNQCRLFRHRASHFEPSFRGVVWRLYVNLYQ